MFEKIKKKGFQVLALHHAAAILEHDMRSAVDELDAALAGVTIPVEELVRGGGGEGEMTQRLRKTLSRTYGWKKHVFEIKKNHRRSREGVYFSRNRPRQEARHRDLCA